VIDEALKALGRALPQNGFIEEKISNRGKDQPFVSLWRACLRAIKIDGRQVGSSCFGQDFDWVEWKEAGVRVSRRALRVNGASK
jgi:hypothetical protein